MSKQIEKIDALIGQLRVAKKSIQDRSKASARECNTSRQSSKREYDVSYAAMRLAKATDEAHAIAVELGLADEREEKAYADDWFVIAGGLQKLQRLKRKPTDFQFIV